jgi:hypothetical protein
MSLHGGLCYRERHAPPPASLRVHFALAVRPRSSRVFSTFTHAPEAVSHTSLRFFSSRCPREGEIVVLAAYEERCRPTANQAAWEPNTAPQAHPCKRAVSLRTLQQNNVRPTGDPRGEALFVTLTSAACSRTVRPASFAATREMYHLQHALSLLSRSSLAQPRYPALKVLSGTGLPICGFVPFPRTFEHHPRRSLDFGLCAWPANLRWQGCRQLRTATAFGSAFWPVCAVVSLCACVQPRLYTGHLPAESQDEPAADANFIFVE